MKRATTKEQVDHIVEQWHMGVGASELHDALGWTLDELEEWSRTEEIPSDYPSTGNDDGCYMRDAINIVTSATQSPCDGSGGFGPPPDSGLIGWLACPGCENCKPPPETLGSVKADALPTEIKSPEDTWVPSDDSPVPSDHLPRKKKRRVDRAKLDTFIEEMPRWQVQLDGDDWTVRCDVHGLADEPSTFGDVRKAMERADSLNRDYQMRYIDSLDEEER